MSKLMPAEIVGLDLVVSAGGSCPSTYFQKACIGITLADSMSCYVELR